MSWILVVELNALFAEKVNANCAYCGEERSLYVSDDMHNVEAAADYFESIAHLLPRYLEDTADLQKEITGKTLFLVLDWFRSCFSKCSV